MKKFQFKLESVLKVKEGKEDQAKKALEQVLQAVLKLEEEEKQLGYEKKQLEIEWEADKHREKGSGDYKIYSQYLRGLNDKIAQKQDEVIKLKNIEVKKRKLYIEARKEKKIIENLKEKQFEQWKQAFGKAVAKELDDQSTAKFTRNKRIEDE